MKIVKEIQARYKNHHLNRPFIVAIDGLGGAGKTTIAKELFQMLDQAVVIHIDDHIVERKKRYGTGHEAWYEYYYLQWDVLYIKTHLLEKLHQSQTLLRLPFYQQREDRLVEKTVHIPKNSIVIIEGIFLLRDEWELYYDMSIYIDCSKKKRKQRALSRDTYLGDLEARLKQYKNRYWPAETYYITKQKPREKANLIFQYDDLNGLICVTKN